MVKHIGIVSTTIDELSYSPILGLIENMINSSIKFTCFAYDVIDDTCFPTFFINHVINFTGPVVCLDERAYDKCAKFGKNILTLDELEALVYEHENHDS